MLPPAGEIQSVLIPIIPRGVDSADTLLTALDDVRTGGLAVSVVFPEYNRAPADFANLLEQLLKEVR